MILAFVTVPLGGYINVRAAIFCGGILLLATIFLALTFVPKVYHSCHIDPMYCTSFCFYNQPWYDVNGCLIIVTQEVYILHRNVVARYLLV